MIENCVTLESMEKKPWKRKQRWFQNQVSRWEPEQQLIPRGRIESRKDPSRPTPNLFYSQLCRYRRGVLRATTQQHRTYLLCFLSSSWLPFGRVFASERGLLILGLTRARAVHSYSCILNPNPANKIVRTTPTTKPSQPVQLFRFFF